jgi:protoporphyrinogen/coproporphyrinogen III oxidase
VHVLIIGGGITGLSAAYELTQRGVPFLLGEASSRLGGLIHTDRVDGYTIEAGADSVLVQKPAAVQLCTELGLGPRLISTIPPRTAFVFRDGRLYQLPSRSVLGIPLTWSGLARYDLLPLRARVRLAVERIVPARKDDSGDESVASFFARRFGSASVDLIAQPLLGGIHAGRIDLLSIRSLFPRLVDAERRGGVLRTLRRTHPAPAPDGMFRAPSSGMSELVSALERRLPDHSVRLDAPASALRREADGWRVVCGGREIAARSVVIAAPAFVAARLLEPVDADAAALCAHVPYVSTASVALAYPREAVSHPLAGSGFVVSRAHGALRITACTWVSSKWAGRAPAGFVLLRAFIGGADDPDAVDLGDETLAGIATRDLSGVLGISGRPALTRVYRWRNAGAQHNVGHLARMRELEARLTALPGIFVAGSGFRAVGVPDCVADGRAAGAAAAAYSSS